MARVRRNEKNAIFADSLANLYQSAGKFDSAAWFAEEASKFFNTTESWIKAGDQYYQAYTLALDQSKQTQFAKKAQEFYQEGVGFKSEEPGGKNEDGDDVHKHQQSYAGYNDA